MKTPSDLRDGGGHADAGDRAARACNLDQVTLWTVLSCLLIWPLFIGGIVAACRHVRRQRQVERDRADRQRFIDEQVRRAWNR